MGIQRFFSGCSSYHEEYHYGCNSCLIATVGKMAHFLDDNFPEDAPTVKLDPDFTPK